MGTAVRLRMLFYILQAIHSGLAVSVYARDIWGFRVGLGYTLPASTLREATRREIALSADLPGNIMGVFASLESEAERSEMERILGPFPLLPTPRK